MLKIVSTVAFILMFVLMVPAGLIMISQDAAKGDWNYPIKRGIEDVILSAASLTPYTKAYFAVALANRRYEETEKLLALGADADHSLNELVTQTKLAASDINKLSTGSQKAQLTSNLSESIQKYDQGLAQAQQDLARRTNTAAPSPSIAPSLSPSPSSVDNQTPASQAPSFMPSPKPQPRIENQEVRKQQEALDKARQELDQLRKRLEVERSGPERGARVQEKDDLQNEGNGGPSGGDRMGNQGPQNNMEGPSGRR